VEIMVTDPNAHLLRSGMSADLEIVTESYRDVPLIPVTAVKGQGKRRFVELATGEQRPIKTGATDGVKMVVIEGLSEGDEIISSGSASKGPGREERGGKRMMPFGPPRGKR
jgi:HlyD family secretion protein